MDEQKNINRFRTYEEVPLFLSCQDIMCLLGLSRATVYALFKSRDFPFIKTGRFFIVRKEALFQWIASHEKVIDENAPIPEAEILKR